jgi:hypothetical protein
MKINSSKNPPEPGITVACLVVWSDIPCWITAYFGEEDLWYEFNHDSVIDDVIGWVALPNPEEAIKSIKP